MKHRQEIEGTYLKMVYTSYKGDDKEFDDRPHTGIKCVAKIVITIVYIADQSVEWLDGFLFLPQEEAY